MKGFDKLQELYPERNVYRDVANTCMWLVAIMFWIIVGLLVFYRR